MLKFNKKGAIYMAKKAFTACTGHKNLPVKVLQIGEGNFLRAFADILIDDLNDRNIFNSSIAVCQPRSSSKRDIFLSQNCNYNVIVRGVENGKTVNDIKTVTSVSEYLSLTEDYGRFLEFARSADLKLIISNTTEAGIAFDENDVNRDFPETYPGKLTAFLYERCKRFKADKSAALLILPCELIENNGGALKQAVLKYAELWNLEDGFKEFINFNIFASTLVDRIVTGKPQDESLDEACGGDMLLDVCEPYMFWAIEADERAREIFPADSINKNIIFTENIAPYRKRKVRILNGAHSMFAAAALLYGKETVFEAVSDGLFSAFIKKGLYDEIVPVLGDTDGAGEFAAATLERFSNGFLKHRLADISLNYISKFKHRCLDSIIEFTDRFNRAPDCLCLGLAAVLELYRCEKQDGSYIKSCEKMNFEIKDDESLINAVINAEKNPRGFVYGALSDKKLWGLDLAAVTGVFEKTERYFNLIKSGKIKKAVEEAVKGEM